MSFPLRFTPSRFTESSTISLFNGGWIDGLSATRGPDGFYVAVFVWLYASCSPLCWNDSQSSFKTSQPLLKEPSSATAVEEGCRVFAPSPSFVSCELFFSFTFFIDPGGERCHGRAERGAVLLLPEGFAGAR